MSLRTLIPVILITLSALSCQNAPDKGVVTSIDSGNLDKFWTQKECTSNSDGVLLVNQGAGITSKFKVRNFEFSVKLKSTQGAEGMLSFATLEGASGSFREG